MIEPIAFDKRLTENGFTERQAGEHVVLLGALIAQDRLVVALVKLLQVKVQSPCRFRNR